MDRLDGVFSPLPISAKMADRVAEILVTEIRAGRFVEGDRLPSEVVLVEQFGVSRTVVREALSRLRSLGLVEARQGSGVYVKALSGAPLQFDPALSGTRSSVIQIAEVRRALEAEVAALAASRRTSADIEAIEAAAQRLEDAVARGGDGVAEDVALHRAVADCTRNPYLISTQQYISHFMLGAIRITRANEARRKDFTDNVRAEHNAIVEAVVAGDPDRARAAAARHMANSIKRIESADPSFWSETEDDLEAPPPPELHGV